MPSIDINPVHTNGPVAPRVLKYLFTVLYLDNSVFQQPAHDISAVDPKRSSFTDAIHRIENGQFVLDEQGQLVSRMHEIHRFLLQADDDTAPSYMVDLTTGHFEVNCIAFRFHEVETEYFDRRLVFSRRHYHEIVHTAKETKTGAERIVYRIGWSGKLANGKDVQFVMEID